MTIEFSSSKSFRSARAGHAGRRVRATATAFAIPAALLVGMRTAAAEAPKPATAAETAEVGAPARPQAKVIERRDEAQKAGKTGLVARFDALLTTLARVDRAERLAAELARKVEELQRKSVELERRAARAVTLIEQTEARRARALARLQELGLNEKDALVVERQADIPVPAESPKGGTK